MAELAKVLWSEIQQIEDESVRSDILSRVSSRLAEAYGGSLPAALASTDNLRSKMESIAGSLRQNQFVASVEPSSQGQLPILKISGCPYPDLSEADHEICEVETAMLTEMLGRPMYLSQCRCNSPDGTCTFEIVANTDSTATS